MRPCERCGASEEYVEEYGKPDPMCAEIAVAYGVIAWLCFDCRKAWHSKMKSEMLSKQYSEATLRFEHWKAVTAASGTGDIEEGLTLWRQLDTIEAKLNALANEWLIADVDDSKNSLYHD